MNKLILILMLIIQTGNVLGDDLVKNTQQVLKVSGLVYSKNKMTLSAETSGLITYIKSSGSKYKKNDVLVKIDNELSKKNRASISSEIQFVKKSIFITTKQVERYENMNNRGSVSIQDNENKTLELYKLNRELKVLQRALLRIDNDINKKTISAIDDGTITLNHRQKGEYVSIKDDLLDLLEAKEYYVMAKIPAKETSNIYDRKAIMKMTTGDSIDLVLDYVGSIVSEKTNTIDVSYRIMNDKDLRPGVKGTVHLY